jgi:hypothetical protein
MNPYTSSHDGEQKKRRGALTPLFFFMDGAALWIPAFFMALLLSGIILTPLLKAALKVRYAEYQVSLTEKAVFERGEL